MSLQTAMDNPKPPPPWWTFGHVWLLIAGPAVVVVAGFVTLWLALTRPDPVLAEDYYRRGLEINRTLPGPAPDAAQDNSLTPAIQARNHAATPAANAPR